MAFPFEHYVIALGGNLGQFEQWSMTLRTGGQLGAAQTPEEEAAATIALRDAIRPLWQAAGNPCSQAATFAWLKYNRVGTDGRYVRNVTNVADVAPAVTGTSNTYLPPQNSLVVTLTTAAGRGLASKGRVYLPSPGLVLTTNSATLTGAQTQTVATWAGSLISTINAVPGVGNVIVASSVRAGEIRPVTGVSVGNVIDTMRSRRGKIPEVRSTAEVTSSGVGGGF